MTDTQLKYFITIVEEGSFMEASLKLDISQSSVSKTIMQLEDELGIKLFDRSYRRARLTSAGAVLFEESQKTLAEMERFKTLAVQLKDPQKEKVRILALPLIGHIGFYDLIQKFEKEHVNIDIEIAEVEEPELFLALKKNEYDAALTYFDPDEQAPNAKFYPLFKDEFIVVCKENDPLAKKKAIEPGDLNGRAVLSMHKHTIISRMYELYFYKHGIKPDIIFRGRPESILSGAISGRAPALLTSKHIGLMHIAGVRMIPFNPGIRGVFGIIINEKGKNAGALRGFTEYSGILSKD